jgi:hypothetical protein
MSEKTPLLPHPVSRADASPRHGFSIVSTVRVLGTVAALGLVYYSISDGMVETSVLDLATAQLTDAISRQPSGTGLVEAVLDPSLRPCSFRNFVQSLAQLQGTRSLR